jgi:hypothetical protein
MFAAINDMLLDILAAVARKDFEDRRRRQMHGQAKAKAEGEYVGRPERKTPQCPYRRHVGRWQRGRDEQQHLPPAVQRQAAEQWILKLSGWALHAPAERQRSFPQSQLACSGQVQFNLLQGHVVSMSQVLP